jgi:hypothetical protein
VGIVGSAVRVVAMADIPSKELFVYSRPDADVKLAKIRQ